MKLKFALDPIRNPSMLGTTAAQFPMSERIFMMQRVMGEFNQGGYGYGNGVTPRPLVWSTGVAEVKGPRGKLLWASVDNDLLSVAVRPSKAGPRIEMKVRDWMTPFDGSPPEVKTLLGAPGAPLTLASNADSTVVLSFNDPIVTGVKPAGADAALRLRDLAGSDVFSIELQASDPFDVHPSPQEIIGITERTVAGEKVFAVELAPERMRAEDADDDTPTAKSRVVLTKTIMLDNEAIRAQNPLYGWFTLKPGDPRLAGTPNPIRVPPELKPKEPIRGPDLRKVPKDLAPAVLEAWRKMIREYRATSVRIQVQPEGVLLTDPMRSSGGQMAVVRTGETVDNYNSSRTSAKKSSELGF